MATVLIDTRESLTTLSVERVPTGRVRVGLDTRGAPQRPVIRPMLLRSSPLAARVSLVPEGALLLAGDAVRIQVYVGPGACLELVEPGGTVAYDMRGGSAAWNVDVELAAGARLVWHGEPFVCAQGSDVTRRTSIRMAPGAVCALRETLVFGRDGETGGRLRQVFDSPMLREDLETGHPLLLGGHRVLGTITLLGARLETGMQLHGEGTLLRRLCEEAHHAVPAAVWASLS